MTKDEIRSKGKARNAGCALGRLVDLRLPGILRHYSLVCWMAVALLLGTLASPLAQAQPPPQRVGVRSNLPPVGMRTNMRTNQAKALPPGAHGAKTNAVAGARQTQGKPGASLVEKLRLLPKSRFFYPALAVVFLCLGIGAILLSRFSKPKSKDLGQSASGEQAPSLVARLPKRPAKKVTISSCNVLQISPEGRRLWQFDARSSGFVLSREQVTLKSDPLPGAVSKDWRTLWQHKLNVAFLPPESVFLRVAHFPQSEFTETLSMVELQLEKLSPMPVAQIVWSIHSVPHAKGDMQTVIVLIVARSVVEEFLGQLEGQGYLADRLELPLLDQLEATSITEDGAWIYPETSGGKGSALVAWWYGGVLQNLGLVHLSPANGAESLKEQLSQMAWSGEMEGWLLSPPRWHLVARPELAQEWAAALQQGLEQTVQSIDPLPVARLAALTAARAAQAEPLTGLLPAEYTTRYHQQFVDRLWMRGLGAVVGLYLFYVLVFFVRLQIAQYKAGDLEQQVAALGLTYTNALQMKARYLVLKDRQDLKFAALDCWKTVAEYMPEGVTLDGWNFSDGKKLALQGTAPKSQVTELSDFESKIRKAPLNGQPMFDPTAPRDFSWRDNPDRTTVNWSFSLELNRAED